MTKNRFLIIPLSLLTAFSMFSCSEKTETLKNILSFPEIAETEITEIRMESGYSGIGPGNRNEVMYTRYSSDIQEVLSLLSSSCQQNKESLVLCGGSYKTYTLYTKDNEYTFTIRVDGLVYSDTEAEYTLSVTAPTPKHPYAKGYRYISGDCTVYDSEGSEKGVFSDLCDIDFTESKLTLMEGITYDYALKTGFDSDNLIYLYGKGYFQYKKQMFEVIGKKNFSSLYD